MRLCLMNCYKPRTDHHGSRQSLGCMRLAAMAVSMDPSVTIELMSVPIGESPDLTAKRIIDSRPTLVGCSVQALTAHQVREVLLRLLSSGYVGSILVGGPHANSLHSSEWPGEAVIVQGEGEHIIQVMLRSGVLKGGNVSQMLARWTPCAEAGSPLMCGVPLFSPSFLNCVGGKERIDSQVLLWETCRGCVYKCGFCGHKLRPTLTYFPWELVEEEVLGIARLEPGTLFIVDPIFGGNPKRTVEVLALLNRSIPSVKLTGYTRAEELTDQTVRVFAESNISELMVGVQTLNSAVPRWLRANNTKVIRDRLPTLTKLHIPWRAELIIGLPGDDYPGLRESLRYVVEDLQPRWIRAYPLMAIHGTKLYDVVNTFNARQWIRIDSGGRVVQASSYSAEELNRMKVYAGALTSLYCFLNDIGEPSFEFEQLDRIVRDRLKRSAPEEVDMFSDQTCESRTIWASQ